MADLTIKEAQQMLSDWAATMRSRDTRILIAAESGMTKLAIARTMGISHNTVYDVLRKHREVQAARNGGTT